MWVYTPNTAYNTDLYEKILVDGKTAVLRLVPFDDGPEDTICFDAIASSIKAFDAVMNGLASNKNTLMMIEQQISDNQFNLIVDYDKTNFETVLKKTGTCLIEDPRKWVTNTATPVGKIISMVPSDKKSN